MKSLRLLAITGVSILFGLGRPCGAQTPPYLDPSPNPLALPTRPQEVQVQAIEPITLAQAEALALKNNLALRTAYLTLEQSQSALRQAEAALYPTLGVELLYQRQESFQLSSTNTNFSSSSALVSNLLNTVSAGTGSTLFDTASGTLTLNYSVYTSGARSNQIRAAKDQVRYNQLAVEVEEADLLLSVKTDYYNLQNADAQVRINQAAVVNAQQSLHDAQAQERAGTGTRFNVLQAQVQLSNSVQSLTNSLSQQQIARRTLWQLLNLSQLVNLSAADPVQVVGTWNLSLAQSIVLADKNRAELEQQLVQMDVSEADRRVALAALGPQVNLVATYGVSNQFDTTSASDNYSIQANVQWELFDGGAARARAAQAEKSKEIAAANFATTRNQIRFNIEQAYYNLQADAQNIQTSALAVQQAQEALRLARLRFQAGVGTQTDVINQEAALTQALGNQVAAIIGYNISIATLEREVSNLAPLQAAPANLPSLTPVPGSDSYPIPGAVTPP